MYRRSIILVILLLLFAAEAFFARQFYIEIVPFPEDEWWMTVVNNCLRDLLLAGVALFPGSCYRCAVFADCWLYGQSAEP